MATGTVHAVGGSPLGITHSSGDLYFFDNATGELVKFNISGASETGVSIAPTYVTEIRVVGSLAFVAGYGDHVAVYATSDGSLVEAFTDHRRPIRRGSSTTRATWSAWCSRPAMATACCA